MPDDIMIGKGPAHPTIRYSLVKTIDRVANVLSGKIRPEKVEGVTHVQLVIAGCVGRHSFE
ncbi:hypothetical protein D3C85_1857050 [compost metagenome]